MADRIQKLLANAGIGSRRQIEALIKAGRIVVDGKRAQLGDRISGNEALLLDGRPLHLKAQRHPRQYLLAYYKPVGELTSRDDPEGRATVFSALRPPPRGRWINVGRLDINSSGLLLFTTDGELAHRLMHPSYEIDREYAVRLLGTLTKEQCEALLAGIELDDGPARLSDIREDGDSPGANAWYRVTLREGRNREVRRLFEALGLAVSRLIRVRYGPIALGRLHRGESRQLSRDEVQALYSAVGLASATER
ncbi:MAG TPA: pseudouridine synthase [Gammaproteobacteria bacterium]|nr:pseudouridine synthase [Gammaproteobacteria bacterium]